VTFYDRMDNLASRLGMGPCAITASTIKQYVKESGSTVSFICCMEMQGLLTLGCTIQKNVLHTMLSWCLFAVAVLTSSAKS
jgi:hypothetical protein